jgi:hypothetical protein
LPPKKRIPPFVESEIAAVGRRLERIAGSRPELRNLVADVWRMMLRIGGGRVASNARCIRFLRTYSPYLVLHDIDSIVGAIERADEVGARRIPPPVKQIEYRMDGMALLAPAAEYRPRYNSRPAADDVSDRIRVAIDAMVAARCRHPTASVRDAAKSTGLLPERYCTCSHITSRKRSARPMTPLLQDVLPVWPLSYWQALHPDAASRPSEWPAQFVFMKCDC